MMRRTSFPKGLQDGLNANFGLEHNRYPELWRKGLDIDTSQKAYEEDVLLGGLESAKVKAEGAGVAYSDGGEGWVARYHHETIALAFSLSEEAVEDYRYGSLGAMYSRELARSMQDTKEIKGHAPYNNGFDAAYPGGDGVPLFSESHPLKLGGTLSNKLATPADVSETAIEAACTQIRKWVDDSGKPVRCSIQRMLIPPEEEFNTHRILKSQLRSYDAGFSTAPNDTNALRDMGMIPETAMSVYFTDPDAWFLKTDCPHGMKHFSRLAVRRGMEGDFESGNLRYKARERYSNGHTNPRGAFGSEGAP